MHEASLLVHDACHDDPSHALAGLRDHDVCRACTN
jgi:hypothetical protein